MFPLIGTSEASLYLSDQRWNFVCLYVCIIIRKSWTGTQFLLLGDVILTNFYVNYCAHAASHHCTSWPYSSDGTQRLLRHQARLQQARAALIGTHEVTIGLAQLC